MTTVDEDRISRIEWMLLDIALWAGNDLLKAKAAAIMTAVGVKPFSTPAPERETCDDTVTLPPALVERMVALVRRLDGLTAHASGGGFIGDATIEDEWDLRREVRAIVAELPEVDDDDGRVSDVLNDMKREGFLFANPDQALAIAERAFAAGRQLEREGRK